MPGTKSPRRFLAALLLLPAVTLPLLPAAAAPAIRPAAAADTSRVFQLGAIEVVALRPQSAAVVEDRISGKDLRQNERLDYAQALSGRLGLVVLNGGQRNEAGLSMRSFDLRQISLFVDGIPVYVPYDGNVDLHRFTTFDVSRITVAKGFSSILYGPNALGGAINVQSRRPAAGLEVSGGAGALSGSGYQGDLTVGTRRSLWYALASGSILRQETFPLASDFRPVRVQPEGDRYNAKRLDWRAAFKLGWTPNATDEYALAVTSQHGEKGNPPYAGTRSGVSVRYWQWPQWDKDDVYFLSQTRLPWSSVLKGRLYYDRFQNQLFAYDDSTFTTMNKKSSFKSYYDDPTAGGSLEWAVPTGADNTVRTTVQGKFDRHQEHNAGSPESRIDDLTWTLAGEDTWAIGGPVTAVLGVGFSTRNTSTAQNVQNGVVVDLPTGSASAWNGAAALVWDQAWGSLRGSVARRTRFPTMKDRFSFKGGSAIPNPDLEPETADHFEIACTATPQAGLRAQASFFYSRIADLIQNVDNVVMVDSVWLAQTRNVGDARAVGFEVGLDATPLRALAGGLAYSYVDRKNLDAPEIKAVGVPRHQVTAYVDVTPVSPLALRATLLSYGERYATSTGLRLAPFATFELRGTVKVRPGVTLDAGVANLFDMNYELDEGYPEPGRTYYTDLRFGLTR